MTRPVRIRGLLAAIPMTALLAACSSTPPRDTRAGDVAIDVVEPKSAGRLSLAAGQRFVMGRAIADDRAMPAYPAHRLAEGLVPLTVCAELETGPDGDVTAVRRLTSAAGCAPAAAVDDADFFTAVEAAVSQWRYAPSWLCADDGRDPDPPRDHCGDMPGTPIPLLRAYRFTFSQRDGQASVGVADGGG